MIPEEAIIIAETLALEYKGLKGDYEQYLGLAMKIYDELSRHRRNSALR